MTLVLVAAFALAYLLGSIPFGLIVSRVRGMDIRQAGSGNIGATNVWRVLGWRWGLATFLCDFGKGLVAVLIARQLAAQWVPNPHADELNFAGIAAAIGCILGHNFPIWLGFKGGKGVATSLGVITGMMPLASLAIFLIWGITLKLTRYVSLASIMGALSLPLVVLALLFAGLMHGWASFYFAVAAMLMVVIRHIPNIRRLLAGTEHRTGSKPAADSNEPTDPDSHE